jgi:hypothetical protein
MSIVVVPMHSVRRYIRLAPLGVLPGLLAVVLTIGSVVPAVAQVKGAERREVKRIKKELVALEHGLEDARRERSALRVRIRTLNSEFRRMRKVTAHKSKLFVNVSQLVSLLVARTIQGSIAHAHSELADVERRITSSLGARDQKIDRLQRIAVRERIQERGVSNWDVDGSLITYSADWEQVALCESSGRWTIDAEYDGGLQFLPSTWLGFGGGVYAPHAYQATKLEQISIAERVLAIQGSKAWPNCFHPLPIDFGQ